MLYKSAQFDLHNVNSVQLLCIIYTLQRKTRRRKMSRGRFISDWSFFCFFWCSCVYREYRCCVFAKAWEDDDGNVGWQGRHYGVQTHPSQHVILTLSLNMFVSFSIITRIHAHPHTHIHTNQGI